MLGGGRLRFRLRRGAAIARAPLARATASGEHSIAPPQDDAPWYEELVDAVLEFFDCSVLPDDELMRDAVLAETEYECLLRHKRGEDVRDMMAVLDNAARAWGST